MKILVVSMLRLGDLIMAAQSIVALRSRFPDAEIHLLTNRSNEHLAKLFKNFAKVHYFDRDQCQKSLGEIDRSVFEATDRIDDLVKRLSAHNFEKVINLTQNKISAHLSGMIRAEEYHGMITSETGVIHLSSPWFRHLNNYIAGNGSDIFHYVDLFRGALGFDSKWDAEDVFRSSNVQALKEQKNRLVVQAWSSDEKKDYSKESWSEYLINLKRIQPDLKVSVLGAPQEKARVSHFIDFLSQKGVVAEPALLTFEELLNYLPRQSALISVDTSVKHLAGAIGCRVIEIALGSSDPRKTGVYREGSLIVRSRVQCSPCAHASICPQPSYLCEEQIDPQFLAMATNEYLLGNWPSLRILAEEYREDIYVGRVGMTKSGLWYTQSLHPIEWQQEKEALVNLESWKFTLNRKHLEFSPPFREVARSLAPTLMDPQKLMVDRLESVSRQTEMNVDRVTRQIHDAVKDLAGGRSAEIEGIEIELRDLESNLGLGDYLSQNLRSLPTHGISSIRALRESLNELRNFQVAKTNILRSIQKLNQEGTI